MAIWYAFSKSATHQSSSLSLDYSGIPNVFVTHLNLGLLIICQPSFSDLILGFFSSTPLLLIEEFQRATRAVTGSPLHPLVVDVIFTLFDADGDGHLSSSEFIDCIRGHGLRHLVFVSVCFPHSLQAWYDFPSFKYNDCSLESTLLMHSSQQSFRSQFHEEYPKTSLLICGFYSVSRALQRGFIRILQNHVIARGNPSELQSISHNYSFVNVNITSHENNCFR